MKLILSQIILKITFSNKFMIPLRVKEYIQKKTSLESRPFILNIEVTSVCNLDCPICPSKDTIKKGFIEINLIKKIIQENIDSLHGQCVWLHFSGEPLLHPELPQIIRIFKENNIETRLSTNGTVLSEANAHKLMEAGLDYIVFSVDGVKKGTYEKIRKGANFEEVEKNILNFLKIKKDNNYKTKTQIQFIKTIDNASEEQAFVKKWMNTDIDCVNIKSFSTRAGRVSGVEKFTDGEKIKERTIKRSPCFYFWETLIILWDGRVVVCCQDLLGELVVGNINSQTLTEIWNSSRMVNLRKQQLDGNLISPCSECADWKKCSTNYSSYLFKTLAKFFVEKIGGRILKDEGINIIFNKKNNQKR